MNSHWVVIAPDYHCFQEAKDYYRMAGIKAKYVECGCNYDYYAIFYVGKQTDEIKKVIKKLKKDLAKTE